MKKLILTASLIAAISSFGVLSAAAETSVAGPSIKASNPMDAQAKMMKKKKMKKGMMKSRHSMSGGMNNGMSGGMNNGMSGGMNNGMSGGMNNGMSGGMNNGMSGGMQKKGM